MADIWRDFWIRKTGTGQQVAQLHDRYMMMMMTIQTYWSFCVASEEQWTLTVWGLLCCVWVDLNRSWFSSTTLWYYLKVNLIFTHTSPTPPLCLYASSVHDVFAALVSLVGWLVHWLIVFSLVAYVFPATVHGMLERLLTLRLLMSYIYIYIYIYIYGAPILDVSRSHTTTQHSR